MPESKPTSSRPPAAARSRNRRRSRSKAAGGASAGAASAFRGATPEELAALDALGNEGVWRIDGHDLKVTNLDKVLFKPRPPDDKPITKRELIRYYVTIAPTILPHLKDRPLNLNRFPNGPEGPSFWQKNIKETDPKWLTRWHETGVDGRTDRDANDHLIADGPAALGVAREPGELRDPRLDRETARSVAADVRLHRHRSRREDDLGRHAHAGAPLPGGPRAPRRPRLPQDDRQARHPDLDPDRAEVRLPRDERLGRARQPRRRLDRPGADLLGVVDEEPRRARPASTTRRTRASRRSWRRIPCGRRPARRCRRRSPGTSSTTPTCAPTAGRSATCRPASRRSATCSRPAQTDLQELPPV